MIFLSTPKAYSSYNEPLIYVFDTESTAPRNVELRIKNKETGQTIGRKRLYGVTYGEVDIAPYLRSAAQPTLPDFVAENSVVETSAQIKVVVEAEGVSSPSRTFIAAKVDLSDEQLKKAVMILPFTVENEVADDKHNIGFICFFQKLKNAFIDAFCFCKAFLLVVHKVFIFLTAAAEGCVKKVRVSHNVKFKFLHYILLRKIN